MQDDDEIERVVQPGMRGTHIGHSPSGLPRQAGGEAAAGGSKGGGAGKGGKKGKKGGAGKALKGLAKGFGKMAKIAGKGGKKGGGGGMKPHAPKVHHAKIAHPPKGHGALAGARKIQGDIHAFKSSAPSPKPDGASKAREKRLAGARI